jgi:distribution and morphology protein 12
MALPLKLVITGLRIEADVILAYSPAPKGGGHRVHMCIVDEGADEGDAQDDYGYGAGYGYAGQGQGSSIGQRILPELHIESEIGHADAHVLRNVGKVERFIADAVRKVLVDELVFPNFHTIAL